MEKLVKNAVNTAEKNPPKGFQSWREYWESATGEHAGCCGAEGCYSMDQIEGAHVLNMDNPFDNDLYIVPLCKACNHRQDIFRVNLDLVLVPEE